MVNLHAEKLSLIEWLIRLQDSSILESIKSIKAKSELEAYESKLKPMTLEELKSRAEASNKAIEEGRYSDIQSIVDENW